ncbi:hypothetical protein ONZ45_g5 [Pleurotus djamor]|nr:hypothetical protein ONZ45_g5 [Pleurotus djamor]
MAQKGLAQKARYIIHQDQEWAWTLYTSPGQIPSPSSLFLFDLSARRRGTLLSQANALVTKLPLTTTAAPTAKLFSGATKDKRNFKVSTFFTTDHRLPELEVGLPSRILALKKVKREPS